jgi:hypothetical protein
VSPSNLKEHIRKESPYCWTDISDKAKYEAMIHLSNFSSTQTRPLWARGLYNRQRDTPNLLARWFLFRRFRLAGTNLQKRYGDVNPENTDYMFVAPSMRAVGKFLFITVAKAYRHLLYIKLTPEKEVLHLQVYYRLAKVIRRKLVIRSGRRSWLKEGKCGPKLRDQDLGPM